MKISTTGPFLKFLAASFLLALMLSSPTFAASFDCENARTEVEKTICENSALSIQDEDMGKVYSFIIDESDEPDAIKKLQKEWLKGRNTCADIKCLKRAYTERLAELTKLKAELLVTNGYDSTDSISSLFGKPVEEQGREEERYSFRLTKGKGVPVCEAYQQRLQQTHFDKIPWCDRPEDVSVPGFIRLNRVYLTAEELYKVYPKVSDFGSTQNQHMNHLEKDWFPLDFVKFQMKLNRLLAWRYDPAVDIDNDGKPDNILILGEGGFACGTFNNDNPYLERGSFVPNVLDEQNEYVDEQRTRELFQHPCGWCDRQYDLFRYIGTSVGVFNYRGVYYFDTFYDYSWGDFQCKRRNSNKTSYTLAVFLRKDNTTNLVCEYYLNNWRKFNGGGK